MNKRKGILLLVDTVFLAILIFLDQITKHYAVVYLKDQEPLKLIDGVFEFRYAENPGVAFSMLEGQRWIFIPITVLIGGLLVVMLLRSPLRRYRLFNITCVLVLSGAVGNLIDRIRLGYVIDMIEVTFMKFAVFNVADCFVVCGAILLVIYTFFFDKPAKKGEQA